MHAFRQRLGQPIRQGLQHDAAVVIVLCLESSHMLVDADARSHRKGADVIRTA